MFAGIDRRASIANAAGLLAASTEAGLEVGQCLADPRRVGTVVDRLPLPPGGEHAAVAQRRQMGGGRRLSQGHALGHLILEAGDRPTGSWADYYDSLTLFSPARYSTLPGHDFPGDPDR
jgi:hypothetical protein